MLKIRSNHYTFHFHFLNTSKYQRKNVNYYFLIWNFIFKNCICVIIFFERSIEHHCTWQHSMATPMQQSYLFPLELAQTMLTWYVTYTCMYFNLPNCPLTPYNKNCQRVIFKLDSVKKATLYLLFLRILQKKIGNCHCEQCMNTLHMVCFFIIYMLYLFKKFDFSLIFVHQLSFYYFYPHINRYHYHYHDTHEILLVF